MFGALRRCPASLSRTVSSAAFSSQPLRLPLSRIPSATRVSSLRANNAPIAAFHQSAKWRQVGAAEQQIEEATQDGQITQFKDLASQGLVHPYLISTITKQMKLDTMTDVQTRTINEALSGADV